MAGARGRPASSPTAPTCRQAGRVRSASRLVGSGCRVAARRGPHSSLGRAFRPAMVVARQSRAETARVVEVSTPEPRVPRQPYLRWLPLAALALFALLPPPSLTV